MLLSGVASGVLRSPLVTRTAEEMSGDNFLRQYTMFWNKGKIRNEHCQTFRSGFSSLDPLKMNLCCSIRALI